MNEAEAVIRSIKVTYNPMIETEVINIFFRDENYGQALVERRCHCKKQKPRPSRG